MSDLLTEDATRRMFDELDLDRDGQLDLREVMMGLKRLHMPCTEEDARMVVLADDRRKHPTVDFPTFRRLVVAREQHLLQIFRQLDADHSGAIDFTEFLRGVRQYNPQARDNDGRVLFQRMDIDRDQRITFGEFRHALLLWPAVRSEALFDCWSRATVGDCGETVAITPPAGQPHVKSLIAGAVAGACSQTTTAPLERLRLMSQVSGRQTGVVAGLVKQYQEGGVRAYWRGNLANVSKVAPGSGIRFWAFERAKRLIGQDAQPLTLLQKLLCGALAGAVSMTAIYPLETIKTCLAVSPAGTYSGIRDCFIKLLSRDGVRGLFPGYLPSLLGILPYSGVDMMVYSALKEEHVRLYPDTTPGPTTLLACGVASNGLGQFVSYPLVVIRTRLQAQRIPGNPQYEGMLHCFRSTLQANGVAGLYRGLTANFLKMVPAAGVFYVTYEACLRRL